MFKLTENIWDYSQKSKTNQQFLMYKINIVEIIVELCQFTLNKQREQNKNTLMKQCALKLFQVYREKYKNIFLAKYPE